MFLKNTTILGLTPGLFATQGTEEFDDAVTVVDVIRDPDSAKGPLGRRPHYERSPQPLSDYTPAVDAYAKNSAPDKMAQAQRLIASWDGSPTKYTYGNVQVARRALANAHHLFEEVGDTANAQLAEAVMNKHFSLRGASPPDTFEQLDLTPTELNFFDKLMADLSDIPWTDEKKITLLVLLLKSAGEKPVTPFTQAWYDRDENEYYRGVCQTLINIIYRMNKNNWNSEQMQKMYERLSSLGREYKKGFLVQQLNILLDKLLREEEI